MSEVTTDNNTQWDCEPLEEQAIEMEEDREYKHQLECFVKSSTEKGIELVKIGELIARLAQRQSFLDIGAGGGDLTIPVSQSFEKTTVVEPNEIQADYLRRRCPRFAIINDYFDRADLGQQRFDFILCSHVLYYIPEGRWLETIAKMYSHLEKDGCIALIIQSPIGAVAEFFRHFTNYEVNILELWRKLIEKYGDNAISVRYFINEIFSENLEDIVSIGLFLLIDRNFCRRTSEIATYFEEHHKISGGYRITQDDIILVVRSVMTDDDYKN
jgi:SAM-dependent methyltransferase